MSCELVFIDKLNEKGFRLTTQREIVLSVLHGFSCAVSAEKIYVRLLKTAVYGQTAEDFGGFGPLTLSEKLSRKDYREKEGPDSADGPCLLSLSWLWSWQNFRILC
ncbi:MAG: hypothetical protein KGY46_08295 [Anaerolineales bacterium]|nr:hypothetical protein [Anaerolineales bacterium]